MKRIVLISWVLALTLALAPGFAYAADSLDEVAGGICAYARGELELQAWIDGPLCESAGSTSDNYVLSLCRSGVEADYSKYSRTLRMLLQENEISNPVSRMRAALALLATGEGAQIPETLVDDAAGELGIMSYAYALHLLNNNCSSTLWTPERLIGKMLDLRLQDGGWAVMGQTSDVDVTAMCLQALAPYAGESADLNSAAEEALALLAQRQLESGGFASMGMENAESTAQVLLALQALNIDPETDQRFLKEGRSAVDALLDYRCETGGFAHLPGGAENQTASGQALQALTALGLQDGRFYDFSRIQSVAPRTGIDNWKIWAWIAVGICAVVAGGITLLRDHGAKRQLAFIFVLALSAAWAIGSLDLQSKDAYYAADNGTETAPDGYVYISIRCDTVAGRASDGTTPEDGVILPRTRLPYSEGDSVFDVLTSAVRQNQIHMEHEGGSGDMAYVSGINNLYEYAYGDLSGWIYSVNGDIPAVGCGSRLVQDGDEICWKYTLELGEDLT